MTFFVPISFQADAESALRAMRDLKGVSIDGSKPIKVNKEEQNVILIDCSVEGAIPV